MRKQLLVAAVAFLLAGTASADDTVSHPFSASLSRTHVRRVVIDIPAGSVRIRNSTDGRIAIRGEILRRFDGYRRRAAQQAIANDIAAEIVVAGDEAIIRRHYGPGAQSWNARSTRSTVEINIDLPPGVDIDVATRYGDVDIEGAFGRIDSELRAGEIHLRTPRLNVRDLRASVLIGEVHTYFGDHYIENEGVFPRVAHFHNAIGRSDISVHATFGEVHVTLTQ